MDEMRMIYDNDEVDLSALIRTLREAEIRVSDKGPSDLDRDVQREQDRSMDRRAEATAGGIAASACLRFDGQVPAASEYRAAKERRYSMYAMHPDTAEQIIRALEAIRESVGPRYRMPIRSRRLTAQTVRNSTLSDKAAEGKDSSRG